MRIQRLQRRETGIEPDFYVDVKPSLSTKGWNITEATERCSWGSVWSKVKRENERKNVGNRISPSLITVIRAGVITVNIEGLRSRSKRIQKCIV